MRDGNRCVVCGATQRLSVHHVVKARDGGRDTLDNLVTLCVTHHRRADAARRVRGTADGKCSGTGRVIGEKPTRDVRTAAKDPRYQDDPERGIYWGPPSDITGRPMRWSRPWHDWRNE